MALTIRVKVAPSSNKYEWQQDKAGNLKCFLKNAPEKGAANKELIKQLSKLIKVCQQDIEISAGLTDRYKTIRIHTDMLLSDFLSLIGIIEIQTKLTK